MKHQLRRAVLAATTILAAGALTPPPVQAISRNEDRVRGDQWHLRYLRTAEAHRISKGDGTIVAVPDTGVYPHPDLAENLLSGKDIVAGGGNGWSDASGHGTGMAGLIAAHGRKSNTGALGIAPNAKILPIFVSPQGGAEADALAAGIEFAINRHVDVISISSGGGLTARLRTAVEAAVRANIVVVAAAGNYPEDPGVIYPASLPGVIAAGGITRTGEHAAISVTGPEVDVVAPAVDIYSTSINGKYRKGTGTSSATAIVAGAAALVRSKYPDLPADEVVHRLTATAVDKGPPGRDDQYGYGVIDLVAALTADVPPLGFESAVASAPADGGGTATAAAEAADEGDGGATARGLATLGVIVAAGGAWALIARRRRRGDDPPPRISR
ncbi:S8 family serine peptidase [Micromonospora sp. NPDC048830]|uniref:S8 family serine peptidase n=1 Tax=Micromonospora sp. NPDC048830 TaxID=3364257 RepID=UPI0037161AD9